MALFKLALELVKTLMYKVVYFYVVFSFYNNLIFIDLHHNDRKNQSSALTLWFTSARIFISVHQRSREFL